MNGSDLLRENRRRRDRAAARPIKRLLFFRERVRAHVHADTCPKRRLPLAFEYFRTIFPSTPARAAREREKPLPCPLRPPWGRRPQTTSTRACSRETAEGNGPAFNVNRHARLIRGRKERERPKAEVWRGERKSARAGVRTNEKATKERRMARRESDGATTRLARERGRDRGRGEEGGEGSGERGGWKHTYV